MKVDGRHFRSIWLEGDGRTVGAIDQRRLPHEFVVARITSAQDATEAGASPASGRFPNCRNPAFPAPAPTWIGGPPVPFPVTLFAAAKEYPMFRFLRHRPTASRAMRSSQVQGVPARRPSRRPTRQCLPLEQLEGRLVMSARSTRCEHY